MKFKSASSVSLAELATAFNTGFEGYFYPPQMTVDMLSRRVRMEHLDLGQSLLVDNGEEFVGFALFGLRGREAWCGGLGIAPEFRGRGYAQQLMSEFIARARGCGVKRIRLEVLTKNVTALRLYERAGMHITRDLLILERTNRATTTKKGLEHDLKEHDPALLLKSFERLHAWRPAWQREFTSLLSADGLHGLYIGAENRPDAYALLVMRPDGVTQVIDLAASTSEHATELIAGLNQKYDAIRVVNEPEESLFVAALLEEGFIEVERQHEMACEMTAAV